MRSFIQCSKKISTKQSHLIYIRSGVDEEKRNKMKNIRREKKSGTADLCAGHIVVRRSQPHCGDAPSSRRVAGPNLWPRHLRLFMR
jgi:hypothetical protein